MLGMLPASKWLGEDPQSSAYVYSDLAQIPAHVISLDAAYRQWHKGTLERHWSASSCCRTTGAWRTALRSPWRLGRNQPRQRPPPGPRPTLHCAQWSPIIGCREPTIGHTRGGCLSRCTPGEWSRFWNHVFVLGLFYAWSMSNAAHLAR